jgi:hypothetical protein
MFRDVLIEVAYLFVPLFAASPVGAHFLAGWVPQSIWGSKREPLRPFPKHSNIIQNITSIGTQYLQYPHKKSLWNSGKGSNAIVQHFPLSLKVKK